MIRRRREVETTSNEATPLDALHEWVLSLPWVVERPYEPGTPGARCFGVDCEPLGCRQVWLVTGLPSDFGSDGSGIAVVLPADAAVDVEAVGWGQMVAPLPDRHVLVVLSSSSVDRNRKLEALVLTAYSYAMS
jgi:hypothetical protein